MRMWISVGLHPTECVVRANDQSEAMAKLIAFVNSRGKFYGNVMDAEEIADKAVLRVYDAIFKKLNKNKSPIAFCKEFNTHVLRR